MKKFAWLCILICIVMTLNCASVPALATETEAAEATAPATLSFGQVSLYNGCRGIDAQIPLGGNARMLESAQSAFVYDINTQTLIYAYNPDMKLHPGTLSKIVTALITIEQCELDEVVTVSSRNISRLPAGSLNQNLKEGELLSVNDLLHCLVLQSANDAAIALSEHVAGSQDAFVELMNERIVSMGCTNTQFNNVHGLATASQYTTARDMAKIFMAAMENETFRELFSATSYTVPATNRSEERSFVSQNYLIEETIVPKYNDNRVTAGLASYVNADIGAGIVCTAESKNINVVCVILGATRQFAENGWQVLNYGNFDEMIDLLEYTYNNYKMNRLVYEGQSCYQLPVNNGECDVVGEARVNVDTVLPKEVNMANLIVQVDNRQLTAPLSEGTMIATMEIWYRNCCVTEVELFAMNSVRAADQTGVSIQSSASRDDGDISGFLGFLGIVILVIAVAMAIYLGYNALRRARVQARRRRRRANRRRSR